MLARPAHIGHYAPARGWIVANPPHLVASLLPPPPQHGDQHNSFPGFVSSLPPPPSAKRDFYAAFAPAAAAHAGWPTLAAPRPRKRTRHVTFSACAKRHDGLRPETALLEALVHAFLAAEVRAAPDVMPCVSYALPPPRLHGSLLNRAQKRCIARRKSVLAMRQRGGRSGAASYCFGPSPCHLNAPTSLSGHQRFGRG